MMKNIKLNILVVDDSAIMRSIIVKTLKLSGLSLGEIHEAKHGADGLKVLRENWIDLAFIDLNMPVMDGESMIDRIRLNPETADLEIIVVSTEGCEVKIEALRKKGIKLIYKPFAPETLCETVFHLTEDNFGQFRERTFQSNTLDF